MSFFIIHKCVALKLLHALNIYTCTCLYYSPESAKSQVCGLRPKRVSGRSLGTFQLEDGQESDTNDKILGGSYAAPGEFPWQANLRMLSRSKIRVKYKPECGGAIVNSYWILSAAHCFA